MTFPKPRISAKTKDRSLDTTPVKINGPSPVKLLPKPVVHCPPRSHVRGM